APLWPQPFEKGADRCAAAAFTHPEDAARVRIEHDGGVAMAFEKGKFIHDQAFRLGHWKSGKPSLQILPMDLMHCTPMQSGQFANMGNGQLLAPVRHKFG